MNDLSVKWFYASTECNIIIKGTKLKLLSYQYVILIIKVLLITRLLLFEILKQNYLFIVFLVNYSD